MAIRTRGQKVALSQKQLHAFLDDLFGETNIHAARLLSVQHALLGVLHAASRYLPHWQSDGPSSQ